MFPLLLMQGAVLWYDGASLCQVSTGSENTAMWMTLSLLQITQLLIAVGV